ncbi:MAG TPA: condensation domain-containing protein, partial [Pseudomonadales bacterium]|nr:condensation domain-containing protein [Pseudomonadales bacterium]
LSSLSAQAILTNLANEDWKQHTANLIPVSLTACESLANNPETAVGPQDPVYVLYTSGSTGEPKGAINIHRGVAHHVLHLAQHCSYTQDDVSLQVSYHTFDSAIEEIFTPLVCGARVVIPETRSGFDLDLIIELIDSYKVTMASIVPSVFNMLVEAMQSDKIRRRVASLRHVLLGGEAVTAKTAYKFRQWFDHARVTNTYGPSECSVAIIYYPIGTHGNDSVPIGRPIHQVYSLILDAQMRLLPAGLSGELYLGGVCVGAGYYQNEAETEKAFRANPFVLPGNDARIPVERLYKTGDLCRFLSDGNIDFLGRIDQQVKIRGRRMELTEVEAVIGRFPAVQEQAVIVKGENANAKLIAYLVPVEGQTINVNELRQFLKQHLAEFMIPSAFVTLAHMPVTSNGKLDKRALPEPELDANRSSVAYVAPRNAVEQRIVEVWQDVLAHSPIGVNDDFFELGGQSLLATKVVSRVRALFQIELPLRILFESPTVAGLALEVERALMTDQSLAQSVIERVDSKKPVALSYAQQRLWFMDQLEPNNVAFNMPIALRISGDLDIKVLERAFAEIVRRHDSLRTVFTAQDGVGYQVIRPFKSWHLQVLDLSALPPAAKENEITQRAKTDARMPFNLSVGPLFRAQVITLGKNAQGQDETVLLLNMHHIISDGWSMGVLVKEMGTLYIAYRQGLSSPLPELTVQYADFAAWQRQHLAGERLEQQLAWWKQQLAGAPEMLRLPTDKPRPKVKTSRGATEKISFSSDENRAIKQFCREQGTTPFILFLAAYQLLLSRYSGQQDICVGVPTSGRTRLEVESLIGFFVNGVILRTHVGGNPTVAELIARAKETTLGAFAHQDVPVEMVVDAISQERTLTHQPGAQAGF